MRQRCSFTWNGLAKEERVVASPGMSYAQTHKRDQLYEFLTKIVDFRAVLRKKAYSYFHVGYAIKLHWKNLFDFQLAAKSPKISIFSKKLTFSEFSDSCLSNYAKKNSVLAIFGAPWGDFRKIAENRVHFFANFVFRPSKNRRTLWIWTNSNWHDLPDIKTVQLFEIRSIFGNLVAHWILNRFFSMHFYSITHVIVACAAGAHSRTPGGVQMGHLVAGSIKTNIYGLVGI